MRAISLNIYDALFTVSCISIYNSKRGYDIFG